MVKKIIHHYYKKKKQNNIQIPFITKIQNVTIMKEKIHINKEEKQEDIVTKKVQVMKEI